MTRVTLTDHELYQAAMIGVSISTKNLRRSALAKHKHGSNPRYAWQYSIMGAIGEYAVSKHLNIHWSGNLMDYGARDVGGYQVRSTMAGSEWALIVHEDNDDNDVFIGVHMDAETYKSIDLLGWCYGREAKRDAYWRDATTVVKPPRRGGDAFFVPPKALHEMSRLPSLRFAA